MDNKGATLDTEEEYVNAEVNPNQQTYEPKYPAGVWPWPTPRPPPYSPEHHHGTPHQHNPVGKDKKNVRIGMEANVNQELERRPQPYKPPMPGQMKNLETPGILHQQTPYNQDHQDGRQQPFNHNHAAGFAESYPAQRVMPKPIVTDMQTLLDTPVNRWCSQCNREVVTLVESSMTNAAWAWCIICCLIGGGLITALVACCLNGFKEFKHHCPKCRSLIGVYNPTLTGCEILILILATCLPIVIGVLVIISLR